MYEAPLSEIWSLIEEYIQTPKTEILTKQFDDRFHLFNILRAADRRISPLKMKRKTNNRAVLKVLESRKNKFIATIK